MVIGVLIALPIVGIDITVLSVFGGAFGVGLGLGMQKVASNYVSGFAILLDRSIRPGDVVTIADRHGIVTDIKTRYTVVKSLDGTEAIIPNDTVATTTVLNHSNSGRAVAVKLPFSLVHGTDIQKALGLATACAKRQARVLREPSPASLITRLTETAIEAELVIWIADADQGSGGLKSLIFEDILREFNENNVHLAVNVAMMPPNSRSNSAPAAS